MGHVVGGGDSGIVAHMLLHSCLGNVALSVGAEGSAQVATVVHATKLLVGLFNGAKDVGH